VINVSILKSCHNHILIKYDCEYCYYSTLQIVDSMNTIIDTYVLRRGRKIHFLIICPICNNIRVVNALDESITGFNSLEIYEQF